MHDDDDEVTGKGKIITGGQHSSRRSWEQSYDCIAIATDSRLKHKGSTYYT